MCLFLHFVILDSFFFFLFSFAFVIGCCCVLLLATVAFATRALCLNICVGYMVVPGLSISIPESEWGYINYEPKRTRESDTVTATTAALLHSAVLLGREQMGLPFFNISIISRYQ
jgi:hypothetical protein